MSAEPLDQARAADESAATRRAMFRLVLFWEIYRPMSPTRPSALHAKARSALEAWRSRSRSVTCEAVGQSVALHSLGFCCCLGN